LNRLRRPSATMTSSLISTMCRPFRPERIRHSGPNESVSSRPHEPAFLLA